MNIVKIIQNLFFIALAGVILLFLFFQFSLPGKLGLYIVRSGSMQPAIKTGSMAFVRPTGEYKVGDVITFGADSPGNTPTTHRIIEVSGDGQQISYRTKGDANKTADNFIVPKDTVVGKVVLSLPYLGYAIDTARKPWGFLLIIVLPAALIIGEEINNIIGQIRRMRAKKNPKIENKLIIDLRQDNCY
jgi:signal peptidase